MQEKQHSQHAQMKPSNGKNRLGIMHAKTWEAQQ